MFQRQKGFTLFEMMVVVAIIAIIAILVLVRFRAGEQQYKLSQAAQRMVIDLRQAQTMAMSGAETIDPDTGSPYTQIGGYGIAGTAGGQSYELFLYEQKDTSGCPSGTKHQIEAVDLYKGIILTSNSNLGQTASVFFAPPNPTACIDGSSSNDSIEYTLTQQNGGSVKITVTKYGKIEMQ